MLCEKDLGNLVAKEGKSLISTRLYLSEKKNLITNICLQFNGHSF